MVDGNGFLAQGQIEENLAGLYIGPIFSGGLIEELIKDYLASAAIILVIGLIEVGVQIGVARRSAIGIA